MARVALMDKHMFAQLITASVPVLKMNETEIWDAILDEWWRRVRPVPLPPLDFVQPI